MMLKIKKQVGTILIFGFVFLLIGGGLDLEIKTILYSWVILIIGFIIYNLWFNTTKDYINNEKKKISFLNEEFDYLINSVIECEGFPHIKVWIKTTKKKKTTYTVSEIIINRPRKIKKDQWEVLIQMENPSHYKSWFVGFQEFSIEQFIKVLNISDTELDKIITNEKKFNGLTNPIKETVSGYTILNPDVLKKDSDWIGINLKYPHYSTVTDLANFLGWFILNRIP